MLTGVKPWDVVVIGSGACGLTIAHRMQDAGRSALIVDKGSRPGGRLASRPIAGVMVNQGADSAVVDDPEVAAEITRRTGEHVPPQWTFAQPAGELAAAWAAGLTVEQMFVAHLAFDLDAAADAAVVEVASLDGTDSVTARSVVITAPVPQALGILARSGEATALPPVVYEQRLVLLGAVAGQIESGPCDSPIIERVRVRSAGSAGTSAGAGLAAAATAVEVVATAAWSAAIYGSDATLAHADLLVELQRMFPHARLRDTTVKRWRHANAVTTVPGVGFAATGHPLVTLAGDGFGIGGPPSTGIERAVRSGIAMANALLKA